MQIQSVIAFGKPLEAFVVGRRRAVQPNAQALAAQWNQVAQALDSQQKALATSSKYDSWQKADLEFERI